MDVILTLTLHVCNSMMCQTSAMYVIDVYCCIAQIPRGGNVGEFGKLLDSPILSLAIFSPNGWLVFDVSPAFMPSTPQWLCNKTTKNLSDLCSQISIVLAVENYPITLCTYIYAISWALYIMLRILTIIMLFMYIVKVTYYIV